MPWLLALKDDGLTPASKPRRSLEEDTKFAHVNDSATSVSLSGVTA